MSDVHRILSLSEAFKLTPQDFDCIYNPFVYEIRKIPSQINRYLRYTYYEDEECIEFSKNGKIVTTKSKNKNKSNKKTNECAQNKTDSIFSNVKYEPKTYSQVASGNKNQSPNNTQLKSPNFLEKKTTVPKEKEITATNDQNILNVNAQSTSSIVNEKTGAIPKIPKNGIVHNKTLVQTSDGAQKNVEPNVITLNNNIKVKINGNATIEPNSSNFQKVTEDKMTVPKMYIKKSNETNANIETNESQPQKKPINVNGLGAKPKVGPSGNLKNSVAIKVQNIKQSYDLTEVPKTETGSVQNKAKMNGLNGVCKNERNGIEKMFTPSNQNGHVRNKTNGYAKTRIFVNNNGAKKSPPIDGANVFIPPIQHNYNAVSKIELNGYSKSKIFAKSNGAGNEIKTNGVPKPETNGKFKTKAYYKQNGVNYDYQSKNATEETSFTNGYAKNKVYINGAYAKKKNGNIAEVKMAPKNGTNGIVVGIKNRNPNKLFDAAPVPTENAWFSRKRPF